VRSDRTPARRSGAVRLRPSAPTAPPSAARRARRAACRRRPADYVSGCPAAAR
jgi:hypothetical protein